MSEALRVRLLSLRDLALSLGPFVLLGVLLLALAYWWLDPTPPRHVTLATGPAQSAYEAIGKRYAQELATQGIQVHLLPSAGSSDNLRLLQEGRADLGFVQGGSVASTDAPPTLEALGSLFVEPVWLFYRAAAVRHKGPELPLNALGQLKGLRLNTGTPPSGLPNLVAKLMEANHLEPTDLKLSQLDQTPATVALLAGEVDAIVFASAPESLLVQMLLQTPGIRLMDFSQSEAYARRLPFLTPVVLPRGVVDLAADIPSRDVRLVASTTTLLAREGTHPALLQLFSQTSLKLHSQAGWFSRAREFPNAGNSEFRLATEADRTLHQGVPLMQRYLPFWLANLVERMGLALGLIVAVMLPLARIVPPLYAFRIRSRVFRWYGQLRAIEDRTQNHPQARQRALAELDTLEQRVGRISVPLSYAEELYALRNHIELVRERLLKA